MIAIVNKKIVLKLFAVFRYLIIVKIKKPSELIKNQTAGISPSIEPIIFKSKLLTLKIT